MKAQLQGNEAPGSGRSGRVQACLFLAHMAIFPNQSLRIVILLALRWEGEEDKLKPQRSQPEDPGKKLYTEEQQSLGMVCWCQETL